MKLTRVLEDQELVNACEYIRILQGSGIIVATEPPLPGCVNAVTELQRTWNSREYSYSYRHPVWGDFFPNEQPSPLQRLFVDTYLSSSSSSPQERPQVIPGAAVIIGHRIALYPDTNPEAWENLEPVWISTERFTLSGLASRILREIVWQAGRQGEQIFPISLYISEDPRYPHSIADGDWIDLREYSVSNHETRAAVVGWARLENSVVYLHVSGPQASVKSILATLIQGRYVTMYVPDYRHARGIYDYRMFLNPIPGTREYRGILVVNSALQKPSAEDRWAYLLVPPGMGRDGVYRLFAMKVNSLLPVPVLPEWGEALLSQAKDAGLVDRLETGGDIADGIAIRNAVEEWTGLINRMLVEGELSI